MPTKQRITFIVTTALFLLLQASTAFALEVNYIPIPGAPTIDGSSSFIDYINYFFMFMVVAAGLIAVFSMVISGLKILLAAGNPSTISAAREQILGSILGIALLMTSFIILRTINTELITPGTTPETVQPGVYYISDNEVDDYTGDYIYYEAKNAVPDVEEELTSYTGWETDSKLFYKCTTTPTDPGKTLLVWIYNYTEWEIDRDITDGNGNGLPDVTTIKIPCSAPTPGGTEPIIATSIAGNGILTPANANTIDVTNVASFIWDYENPGVYFYLTDNCTGISSYAQRSNGAIKPFDARKGPAYPQQARSMKILSGRGLQQKYGVVLSIGSNAIYGEGGECTAPVMQTTAGYSSCIKIAEDNANPLYVQSTIAAPYIAASAYILNVETQNLSSLRGITLQSKNYRKNIDSSDFTINGEYHWPSNLTQSSNLNLDLMKTDPYEIYNQNNLANDCRSIGDCLQRITFSRDAYYVILYAKNWDTGTDKRCDVFTKPITNVKSINLLQSNRNFYRLYIVPFAGN